jgi:hypothetical protein
MDTSKYNYLIDWHSPVHKGDVLNDGVDMGILIGTTVVADAGHRMFNLPFGSYVNQSIRTLVTSGYTGGSAVTIYGAIASYNGGSIDTHDNHTVDSGSSIHVTVIQK